MFKTRNDEMVLKIRAKFKNITAPIKVVIVARFILFGDGAFNFCVQGEEGEGEGVDTFSFREK